MTSPWSQESQETRLLITPKYWTTFVLLCACLILSGCQTVQESPVDAGGVTAPRVSNVAAPGEATADRVALAIVEPTIDEIVKRLAETAGKARRARVVTEMRMQISQPNVVPSFASSTDATTFSQTWSDAHGRLRTESTMSISVTGITTSAVKLSAAQESLDKGTAMLMVSDGKKEWTFSESLPDYYFERDLTESGASSDSADEQFQMVREISKIIVAQYDIHYEGQIEVAGRPAFSLSATPKNPSSKGKYMGFYINTLNFAADTQTWQILSLHMVSRTELPRNMADADGTSTAGTAAHRSLMQMQIDMTTKEFDPNPNLPDELFIFVPPPGAKKLGG